MIEVSDLIGVNFLTHGRLKAKGFDCYGLAIEVSRRFGHELPDLWYERSTSEMFTKKCDDVIHKLKDRVEVCNEQNTGNLVVFFENGNMVHIGVILKTDEFIHCDSLGVRVLKLSDYYRKEWRIYKWL